MYNTKVHKNLQKPFYKYDFEYPMVKWSITLVEIPARYYTWYMMRKIAYPPKYSLVYMCAQLNVYKNSTAAH